MSCDAFLLEPNHLLNADFDPEIDHAAGGQTLVEQRAIPKAAVESVLGSALTGTYLPSLETYLC